MIVGALLTPCNVYSGLKIGWTFNMSVAAGLIGFVFWSAAGRLRGTPGWGIKENNLNQTAASAAASIISAGLAAPIPALAILTGQTLPFGLLAIWLLVISLLGIVVAAGLRNQLLLRDRLPFPSGMVTAETMSEIHRGGKDAAALLQTLGSLAALSASVKGAVTYWGIGPIAPAFKTVLSTRSGETLAVSAKNLGFALDPSFLMVGFGAISGLRISASLLLGSLLAWGVLAPIALTNGWAHPGAADSNAVWFGPLVEWLLWPGATLMVTASLTSFAISMVRVYGRSHEAGADEDAARAWVMPPRVFALAFGLVLVACVWAQTSIFGIGLIEAVLAVGLSYVLAIVAARVSGETAITPIGALGKITQLTFGAISPGAVSTNLMTANVTGGAAGQCADLMHDLRTGQIIGATPLFQLIAQTFGVLAGAFVASFTYLLLIPDPVNQLITPEWPAPAVATWKAVAEVLSQGVSAIPTGAGEAIAVAAVAGIGLAFAEAHSEEPIRKWLPSASVIGLGFVIPAWNALSMFSGALFAALLAHWAPDFAKKRIMVIAAGLIVGESLAGVIGAMLSIAG